jgi:beta-galactosidase
MKLGRILIAVLINCAALAACDDKDRNGGSAGPSSIQGANTTSTLAQPASQPKPEIGEPIGTFTKTVTGPGNNIDIPALKAEALAPRSRMNFNADWRFQLGDPVDAQKVGFDDRQWQQIGLPHSFGIPYFQAEKFYTGYGWYKKHLFVPKEWDGKRLSLEFEAIFQEAEIFLNGKPVGQHRGGYTGFSVDLTDAAVFGADNVISIRVNNKWQSTLAPRAGEHVFQGGIYRDVWLVTTNPVHVTWYGTAVTTPELSQVSGKVAVATEVRNDGKTGISVSLQTDIVDPTGKTVATTESPVQALAAGQTSTINQISTNIADPSLWSPETPVLYKAVTKIKTGSDLIDSYETDFGFRWIEWTSNSGFYLNGKHRYLLGANVHQDQAGWGDAVTNRAIERDVDLMKKAGFDFIRGSHYPHDPHFLESTDRTGMLFWSHRKKELGLQRPVRIHHQCRAVEISVKRHARMRPGM